MPTKTARLQYMAKEGYKVAQVKAKLSTKAIYGNDLLGKLLNFAKFCN
jgi:predicted CoA-binding protein